MFIAVLIKVKFSSFSALIGNMSQQCGSYKTLARKLPANVNMTQSYHSSKERVVLWALLRLPVETLTGKTARFSFQAVINVGAHTLSLKFDHIHCSDKVALILNSN